MNNNTNNISGNTFSGTTTIIAGGSLDEDKKTFSYTAEPKWRSPFTLAVLNWASFILAVLALFPISKVISYIRSALQGMGTKSAFSNAYVYVLLGILLLLAIAFKLKNIVKRQIREPLIWGYSICGRDNRIVLEKIRPFKCPVCGGETRYFNKVAEWRDEVNSNGQTKRVPILRKPALECKRNPDHFAWVDIAEN